jgi:DNA-binding transcriptional MerR regulator
MVRKIVHGDGWFGAASAARVVGLSLAMVNYLCRTGIVEPSCSCKRGHGTPRHYSFGDLVALRLIARLSATGVQPLRLKRAMTRLRDHHSKITLTSLPASHIVTDGVHLYLRQHDEPIERLIDGQLVFGFVIELAQLQDDVAQGLVKAGLRAA